MNITVFRDCVMVEHEDCMSIVDSIKQHNGVDSISIQDDNCIIVVCNDVEGFVEFLRGTESWK